MFCYERRRTAKVNQDSPAPYTPFLSSHCISCPLPLPPLPLSSPFLFCIMRLHSLSVETCAGLQNVQTKTHCLVNIFFLTAMCAVLRMRRGSVILPVSVPWFCTKYFKTTERILTRFARLIIFLGWLSRVDYLPGHHLATLTEWRLEFFISRNVNRSRGIT